MAEPPRKKPPPGLTGKALGLWYRDRQIQVKGKRQRWKEVKKNEKSMKKTLLPITLRAITEQKIRGLLESSYDNCAESDSKNDNKTEGQYDHINDSQFKRQFLNIISGNLQDNIERALVTRPKLTRNERTDLFLLDELRERRATIQYRNMLSFRTKLPAFERMAEILDLINRNQVVLISGETGNKFFAPR